MAILAGPQTRVVVQGITGREGSMHTHAMLQYGTRVLAGVTPGRGGTTVAGVPVYDSVEEAVRAHDELNASIIFVPPAFAADAAYESIDAGIRTIVVITEHVPIHDVLRLLAYAESRGVQMIGPNCPGIISPGLCKVGIMPGHLFQAGPVGLVSRSGTLTYEIAWALTRSGLGQSTAVGIGGDPVVGMNFVEIFELFRNDSQTKALVVIGEIGGDAEERLASHLETRPLGKPVVAFVAGRTAPAGKRMGHAGAIISMGMGTAQEKQESFRRVDIAVATLPSDVPRLVRGALNASA